MPILLSLILSTSALAGSKAKPAAPAGPPCVADAQKALDEAGPAAAGKAWLDLAMCDAGTARTAAPAAWAKIIAGSGADAASIKAIELGLGDAIRAWVETLQPDERSSFINMLGEQCSNAAVPTFFADSSKALGDKFWTARWFAGLDSCRSPVAVGVLEAGLESQKEERSRFKSILETYARNLGKDAIPKLEARAAAEKDAELASYAVGAFADAAGVGSPGGINNEAAQAAIAAILKLAPALPEKSIEQARTTLLALRDEANSDGLAAQRYRSLAQADGSLTYGIYVVKVATCKKDTKVEVHTTLATNGGHTWPDQVVARTKPNIDHFTWHLPKDCTGDVGITASPQPLKDKAAITAFNDAQDAELEKKNPGIKVKVFPEPNIGL